MSLNCCLSSNIYQNAMEEGCGISSFVTGLQSPLYVFNISDIDSLVFSGDSRVDRSTFIDVINYYHEPYIIEFSEGSYQCSQQGSLYNHQLQIQTSNVSNEANDILYHAKNGKYLIAFHSGDEFKVFGWKYGANMQYQTNLGNESANNTINFTDTSIYPLFGCQAENFIHKEDLEYTPIISLWSTNYRNNAYCVQNEGANTGYLQWKYLVKKNVGGQDLDVDNHLSDYSGKQPSYFRVSGLTETLSGYELEGEFPSGQTYVSGITVYNKSTNCKLPDASIRFDGSSSKYVNCFGDTINSAFTNTFTSNVDWNINKNFQYMNTTLPSTGTSTSMTITTTVSNRYFDTDYMRVRGQGGSGQATLTFRNRQIYLPKNSYESVGGSLVIQGSLYDYTKSYVLTDIDLSNLGSDVNSEITYSGRNFTLNISGITEYGDITFDFNGVTKTIAVTDGNPPIDTGATWTLISSACETGNTGFRINTYQDTNPNSPTFGNTRTERIEDREHCYEEEEWVLINQYCELDSLGNQTGYLIQVYQKGSETREDRVQDEQRCPIASTNPEWVKVEGTEFCEMSTTAKGVQYQNGTLGFTVRDVNPYSQTYGQEQTSGITDTVTCVVPDRNPQYIEVSRTCQVDSETGLLTGWTRIVRKDINQYSDSYNDTSSYLAMDYVNCPPNTPPNS